VADHCPVCQARFRSARVCSRCGADLGPLMGLAVKAWRLRQAARQALERGDYERAVGWASEAQHVHRTPHGESLRLLSAWLHADSARHKRCDARQESQESDLNRAERR
jgi:hypothetical protein